MIRPAPVVALLLAFFAFGATAAARKPIIAYVDQTTHKLALYDAETGTQLTPPNITITSTPGFQDAMAMSFDGHYVFYVGTDNKLHLFDRSGAGGELALPGINIYAKPTGLSVSNTGLLAFDDNVNGPARVYDSATGSFLDIGLDPNTNKDRQSHLSGDGHFLATTCNDSATTCPADNGGHSQLFVQDIQARTDTANPPFGLGGGFDAVDKEHPCINGDGSLVGADVNEGGAVNKQIEIYDRTAGSLLSLPGLNSAGDDTHCVMSVGAAYIGLISGTEFKAYERSSGSFLTLPAAIKAIFNPVSFVMPFPPPAAPAPPVAAPPAALPDRTPPTVKRRFRRSYSLAGALRRGLVGTIRSNEGGTASAIATLGHVTAARKQVVARGSARVTAGGSTKLRLKFTRKARRRLAHARRATLTIRITVKDAAGNATRLSAKTLLKG